MEYFFEWDPKKAESNKVKHKVSFEQAATIFKDPRAISIYDEDHSGREDRWITLGISINGSLLVVHHTYQRIDEKAAAIRIEPTHKLKAYL